MKSRFLLLGLLSVVVLLQTGCGDPLPDGITKVIPVKVKIILNEKPLPKADIQLFGEGVLGGIAISGQTDDQGIAEIKCVKGNWIRTGAPAGHFRVTLQKVMPVEGEKSDEEIKTMSIEERRDYGVRISQARKKTKLPFPVEYSSLKETPLTLEVTENSSEIVLDLDKTGK